VLRDYLFDVVDMIERKSPAEAVACVDELYAKSRTCRAGGRAD